MIAEPSFTVSYKPYRLTLTLPGLPAMTNAQRSRGYWTRYKQDGGWKRMIAALVSGARPPRPLTRYRIYLTRRSSIEPDFDGVVSGGKVLVDALKDCGVLFDDKITNTGQWICNWEKVSPRKGHVRIIIEERTDELEP